MVAIFCRVTVVFLMPMGNLIASRHMMQPIEVEAFSSESDSRSAREGSKSSLPHHNKNSIMVHYLRNRLLRNFHKESIDW